MFNADHPTQCRFWQRITSGTHAPAPPRSRVFRRALGASIVLLCTLAACGPDGGTPDDVVGADGTPVADADVASPPDTTPGDLSGDGDAGPDGQLLDAIPEVSAEDGVTPDVGVPDTGGDVGPQEDAPSDTGGWSPPPLPLERPSNTTCLAFPRPAVAGQVGFRPIFGDQCIGCWVDGHALVGMVMPPHRRDVWYLFSQRGLVERVDANPAALTGRQTVLDLTDRVWNDGERGLLGMAFDPDFDGSGDVWVFYVDRDAPPGFDSVSRLSRFHLLEGTPIDPTTENVVLEIPQPWGNHKGGDLHFGPDGMLYVSVGDGGVEWPWTAHPSQDLGTLLGKILRLDVVGKATYGIPAGNPFADEPGARPEIWALGLRNPWRFSIDPVSGRVFAGDVGGGTWEEINEILPGENYGWPVREGQGCMPDYPPAECETDSTGMTGPIGVNRNGFGNEGVSVIGGHLYRGAAMPGLVGAYIYGDWLDGRLWALREDPAGGGWERIVVANEGGGQVSFARDHDGELYAVAQHGSVRRLEAAAPVADDGFPRRLSDTGCAGDTAEDAAPGMVPYVIHAELFSDGAGKRRYFAIPDGTTVGLDDDGGLVFPVGAVLRKDFRLDGRIVETRLFVRHDDGGWGGYSYRWRPDHADADFVAGGAREVIGDVTWTFPSPAQCMSCHTEAAGFTLGPELAQFAGLHPAGAGISELDRLRGMGIFDADAAIDARLDAPPARLRRPDEADASLEDRARSALHANCAGCHREGAGIPGAFDLRFHAPPSEQGLNVAPERGFFGLGSAARIIVPGAPDLSILAARMSAVGAGQMPPLGRSRPHGALELVREWIRGLR
jgi:glucose/arabinose dehydrogenase